jgi:hypothetical protein
MQESENGQDATLDRLRLAASEVCDDALEELEEMARIVAFTWLSPKTESIS